MTEPEPIVDVLTSEAPRSRRHPWVYVLAVGLLLAHFGVAVGSKQVASTTSDELLHLTAGYSYWQNHDYRLHPENGILPQRWAALPTWLGGARFPRLEGSDSWRMSDVWGLGYQFFYEHGEDHFPRLQRGRAMIALFSVATGMLVFVWASRLFGEAGALVSLTLYAFSPEFLAHGALVTSDVCMVFFFLAAVTAWWCHLHDHRARLWWLSAVTLGLAFVAKYSAVLLVPMMIGMAAVRAFAAEPLRIGRWTLTTPSGKLTAAAISAAGHVLVVAAVIWAFYGFRYAAFNPALPPADHFIRPWADYVGKTGVLGDATRALAGMRLLPEAFLYGFDYVLATASSRAAFLNGEHSVTGWPSFFIWTFGLKSTIPILLITVGMACICARGLVASRAWVRELYPITPLIALFVVYWAVSVTSHLNIGHRHILPTYPVLFIGAGALGGWLLSGQALKVGAVTVLLAWHVGGSLWIAPYHLAYFNALGGGSKNGWRHLVDSSLDWGQDLPTLKVWLEQNARDERAYLGYFGAGQPSYYGIRAHPTAEINNFRLPPVYAKFEAGVYCVSATVLQQVYTPLKGPWTAEREKEYQELRALESLFAALTNDPTRREQLLRQTPLEQWHTAIKRHDLLRMARLTHYLRVRPPDAHAGFSILIYRLKADEVRAATAATFSEWHAAIERAVGQLR